MGDIEKSVEGRWEKTPDLRQIIRFIRFEDMELPVLSLEYEAQAYHKLGRMDKAEMIMQYVNKLS